MWATGPALHTFSLAHDGRILEAETLHTNGTQQFLAAEDIDDDAVPEYLMLSADGESFTVGRRIQSGLALEVHALQAPAQALAIADINNDKRKDVLLFGRTSMGVQTLLGRSNKPFVAGPLLFPDISVAALVPVDLNRDGITDVLLLDWLANRLAVFYGISRMVFSEQVTVDLPSEPAGLAMGQLTRHRSFRVAVAMRQSAHVAVYDGNVLGEFILSESIQTRYEPVQLRFVGVNQDTHPDLVWSDGDGIHVALGKHAARFWSPVVFAIGETRGDWVIADLDADGAPDLAAIDHTRQRLILLGNSAYSGSVRWPNVYAVGKRPMGLALRDYNNNGAMDIAVANNGSSSISLLLNMGGMRFSGQQVVPVPEKPHTLRSVAVPSHPVRTLIASHPETDQITVVHLADTMETSPSLVLPTAPEPYVVLAKESEGRLEMLVRHSTGRGRAVSLSLFQQIAAVQFVERSLKPTLPAAIAALTMDDFTGNGRYDLAFVTQNQKTGRAEISMAFADNDFNFHTITHVLSYGDSQASTTGMVSALIDRDEHKDLLLLVGPPVNALAVALARGDGTFRDSLMWLHEIRPTHEDALVVRDVDMDGINDIVFVDEIRESIVVLYGERSGYTRPVEIRGAGKPQSIRVAPLVHAGTMDLVASDSARGTISILFGPFTR